MDCPDVERALIQGSRPSGPELEAHLATCETCRFLVDDGAPVAQALAAGSSSQAEVDLGELEAATLGDVRADRGPIAALRSLPRLLRLGLVALVVLAACVFFYLFYRRSDWDNYPAARMWLAILSFSGVGLVIAWTALRPLYQRPLGETTRRVLIGVGLLVPLVLSLLPEVQSGFKMPPSMSLVGLAYACNALGGSLGFVVYLVMRTVDRGGQAGSPIGDLAAVGAGIIGVLAVQVHCPVNLQAHLVSGHATIPFVILAVVLLLRRL